MHSPHITQFSPLGARLRAAERAASRHLVRRAGELLALLAAGALIAAAFVRCAGL